MNRLTIQAAERGGYIVIDGDHGDARRLLFAGTLPEVLEFTRAQFADADRKAAEPA